jgi:hypothetical protein
VLRNLGDVLRALSEVLQRLVIGRATRLIEGLSANVLDVFLLFIFTKRNLHVDNNTQASPLPAGRFSSCGRVRTSNRLGELQVLQSVVTVAAR